MVTGLSREECAEIAQNNSQHPMQGANCTEKAEVRHVSI